MTDLRITLPKLAASCLLAFLVLAGVSLSALAAERAWLPEFNEICAKTEIAMTLPNEELEALVARCDQLRGAIEAEDSSTRKVYLRRLQQCRDLYLFVLESKTAQPPASQ